MNGTAFRPAFSPSPRPGLVERLRHGDKILDAAMGTATCIGVGRILVRGGEPQGAIYRLMAGKVARVRVIEDGRRQIICIFFPGDLLAVKAMLVDRQPDNIECLSRASLRALGYPEALALADEHPDVSLRFIWQLAEDERRLHNSVMMLGRGTALERISTALLDLKARIGLLGGKADPVSIRQQDLADYVGLTVVHVNRTLRCLREQGAIETETARIYVRDATVLHQHASPMLDIFERETSEFGFG